MIKIPKEKYEKMVMQIEMLKELKEIQESKKFNIESEENSWNKLALDNPSFRFLKEEPAIYTEEDILEK